MNVLKMAHYRAHWSGRTFSASSGASDNSYNKLAPTPRGVLRSVTIVSGLLAGTASVALAQSAATALSNGGMQLEEVVVTAQKREESLQRVPAAVTTVTAETLSSRATQALEDLARSVPSLAVGNLGLSGQYFLRGIGSGSNVAFEQSLGVYLDGIYFSTSRLNRLGFQDLQRVEILKGPQSTLFAKGTIAGAINISSAKPESVFGAGLNALHNIDGGDRNAVSGYITGPLTEDLSARLAVDFSDQNGPFFNTYTQNTYPQTNDKSARLSVKYNPIERLSVDAMFQIAQTDSRGRAAQIGYVDMNRPSAVAFVNNVLAIDPKAEFTINDKFSAYDIPSVYGKDQVLLGALTASYDFDPFVLKSVTGIVDLKWYENVDSDNTPLPIIWSSLGGTLRQWSQEFRLESTGDGPLQYIAGVYYQNAAFGDSPAAQGGFTEWVTVGVRTGGTSTRTEETAGIFAQVTWSPIDHLRLTGGLRYQKSNIDAYTNRWGSARGTNQPTSDPVLLALAKGVGTVPYSFSGVYKDDRVTPTATIEYDVFEGGMAYASYRTGFKSGGFDVGRGTYNPATFEFQPETAASYEAGLKSTLWEGRARLNFNIFTSTFDNLQVSAFNGTTFTVGNAAKARSRGAEIDAEAVLAPGFTVRGNLSYLDAVYVDFPGSACYSGQTAAQGCAGTPARQNLAGHALPFAPKWAGVVGFDYYRPVTDTIQTFLSADLTYKGRHDFAPDGNPVFSQDGAAKLDARIGFGDVNGGWEFALLGKNLTDVRTLNFGFNVPLNAGAYVFATDPPRTVSLQLRLRH